MKLTKFILHGGFTPGEKQINDSFFKEIFENTKQELKILMVYFATDNGLKYFSEDIEQFKKNSEGRILQFEMATREAFESQMEKADVVYLHGGNSLQMLEIIKRFPDFPKLIKGKIIAADSAGANLLSTIFYSNRNGICEGLGILPIRLIPHCREENKNKLDEMRPELELLQLPEYHFQVITENS